MTQQLSYEQTKDAVQGCGCLVSLALFAVMSTCIYLESPTDAERLENEIQGVIPIVPEGDYQVRLITSEWLARLNRGGKERVKGHEFVNAIRVAIYGTEKHAHYRNLANELGRIIEGGRDVPHALPYLMDWLDKGLIE